MTWDRIKIRLAKLADEYAGRLLIRAAGRRSRNPNGRPPRAPVRKILFIKFWGIGSIILSEPALRWLRQRYPEAEIHYLTFAHNRGLFELIPWVQRVHTLPFSNPIAVLLRTLYLRRTLRRQRFDLVLDAEFFANYSTLLARSLGAARLTGFVREGGVKGSILDIGVPFAGGLHTAAQFLNLVQMGASSADLPAYPRLHLKGNGYNGRRSPERPYIVMNVNASPLAVERRWPREQFVRLARALLRDGRFDLVLIGSSREQRYVTAVEEAVAAPARVRNLAGRQTLVELAHLLQGASLLISNDSGPVHMAAALQVPVVAFYGPETPVRYGPLVSKKLVFYRNLWCSPCMTVDNAKTVNCINRLACIKEIDTDEVVRKVLAFVETLVPAEARRIAAEANDV